MSPDISDSVPGPYEDTTCQMVAAYGNPYHPQLETIRRFRDQKLKSNSPGRALVNTYYQLSSFTAERTSRSKSMKLLSQFTLVYPAYAIASVALKF